MFQVNVTLTLELVNVLFDHTADDVVDSFSLESAQTLDEVEAIFGLII
jgi:hypothetical protein